MTTTPLPLEFDPDDDAPVYTRLFWIAYLANVTLVTGNALTFRFAELVAYLGGTEQLAGTIVGTGVAVSVLTRFWLGQSIDRFGPARLWMFSSLLFIAGCSAFYFIRDLSWTIYAARTVFVLGIAGMFACSMVFIQNQVPAHRRTEVIGSLGSSGFVGMICGTQLGDLIFYLTGDGDQRFRWLFGTAAVLGLCYLVLVLVLTRRETHTRPTESVAAHRLLFRYWPGNVLLVAMMMGVGVVVTTVFLTRFATHRNLNGIGTFFTAYSLSAFAIRIVTRNWSRRVGRHAMILVGLGGHCLGHWTLPLVTSEWHFLLPAACCGLGHAMLFPAVVSLGAGSFPVQYRGTGTTLILGFFDLGAALSAPLLGSIIDHFDGVGFTQMFVTSGAFAFSVAVVYGLTTARNPDEDLALAAAFQKRQEMQRTPVTEMAMQVDRRDGCSASQPTPCAMHKP